MRDWYLWGLQLLPSWRRWLEKGARRDGMVKYDHRKGMAFMPELGEGVSFPQIYCCSLRDGDKQGDKLQVIFIDDVIFGQQKKGLFRLVVLLDRIEDVADAAEAIKDAGGSSRGYVLPQEATYIIHNQRVDQEQSYVRTGRMTVVRIATGKEFAATERLCTGRPEPKYYGISGYRKKLADASLSLSGRTSSCLQRHLIDLS